MSCMIKIGNRLDARGEELLRGCVGMRLASIEGVEVAANTLWSEAALRFEGMGLTVRNEPRDLVVSEDGDEEEVGVMSVTEGFGAAPSFEGMDGATSFAFGETVESVDVVENGLRMLYDGEPLSERSYLQAIVFRLDDGRLVSLDKRTWFGETLAVGVGRRLEDVVRDESVDWEDDPEEMPLRHYEFSSRVRRI